MRQPGRGAAEGRGLAVNRDWDGVLFLGLLLAFLVEFAAVVL